jgi:hypothetical protein
MPRSGIDEFRQPIRPGTQPVEIGDVAPSEPRRGLAVACGTRAAPEAFLRSCRGLIGTDAPSSRAATASGRWPSPHGARRRPAAPARTILGRHRRSRRASPRLRARPSDSTARDGVPPCARTPGPTATRRPARAPPARSSVDGAEGLRHGRHTRARIRVEPRPRQRRPHGAEHVFLADQQHARARPFARPPRRATRHDLASAFPGPAPRPRRSARANRPERVHFGPQ